jgi:penicillin amidase
VETCDIQLRAALADAVRELAASYGADMAKWRWGDAHRAHHENRGLGALPLIGALFNRDAAVSGSWFTLLRQSNRMSNADAPYRAFHGAGYRAVYDLADPDNSRFMISTGQSGNVFSPYYDDLVRLWAESRYITLPARPKVTIGVTDLRPAAAE